MSPVLAASGQQVSTGQLAGYGIFVQSRAVATASGEGPGPAGAQFQCYSAAILDKVEATTPSNGFLAVAPTSRGVEISPWLRRLTALREIAPRWNETDDPPNATALHGARRVLELLFDYDICPSAISASCEGGVLVTFEHGKMQASIEADNDGDMVAVLSDGVGQPEAWMVAGDSGIRHTLERFSNHLD